MTRYSSLISPLLSAETPETMLRACLAFMRGHLGMDVAYLSEFKDGGVLLRSVDACEWMCENIFEGMQLSADQTYCERVVSGTVPEAISDTAELRDRPAIRSIGDITIRSQISIPIRRRNGSAFGMFCCFSVKPASGFNRHDLVLMRSFASLAAEHISGAMTVDAGRAALRVIFEHLMETSSIDMVFQPIMRMATGRPIGFEALSRFRSEPYRPPNLWFDDAKSIGMLADLETWVIEHALSYQPRIPEGCFLSVNASIATIETGLLPDLVQAFQPERVVFEITDLDSVEESEHLLDETVLLRQRGARFALGFSGSSPIEFEQITRLKPDFVKLDIAKSLTGSPLPLASIVDLAKSFDAELIAERVETETDLLAILDHKIPSGQGYLLGRPAGIESVGHWSRTRERLIA